jgi:hypothetical protein
MEAQKVGPIVGDKGIFLPADDPYQLPILGFINANGFVEHTISNTLCVCRSRPDLSARLTTHRNDQQVTSVIGEVLLV